ncbi:FAD/NAD(P)-binding protein [Pandoraea sputorum]|uniref:FAD/NAD(P)-binding protein n=1 Tax=Pandoraea sputorum TaxID=93222 RepID=UPI00123F0173|nr:FAD/NAD(P)-binding protein [Pandoraea sputorum]VVE58909.1 Ni/Fe hydrogenase subunit gamma [Pandoraea sputorum]
MGNANVTADAPGPGQTPQRYDVVRRQREFANTVTLALKPHAGVRPTFTPGQFNMLYAFGVGEAAVSVSGDPADANTFIHTIRDVGAVSGALARLAVGASVGVRGPFGRGWPMQAAIGTDVLIIAGGLGLAPLRPAILDIFAHRRRYGRVSILVGCRHPKEMLFCRELRRWSRRVNVDVQVTVDHADIGWHAHVGVVPTLIARVALDTRATTVFVCGPEVMMRFSINALQDRGLPARRIYLSMERNMKCAIGLCGHCQFASAFVCKDGPVMCYEKIADMLAVPEI